MASTEGEGSFIQGSSGLVWCGFPTMFSPPWNNALFSVENKESSTRTRSKEDGQRRYGVTEIMVTINCHNSGKVEGEESKRSPFVSREKRGEEEERTWASTVCGEASAAESIQHAIACSCKSSSPLCTDKGTKEEGEAHVGVMAVEGVVPTVKGRFPFVE